MYHHYREANSSNYSGQKSNLLCCAFFRPLIAGSAPVFSLGAPLFIYGMLRSANKIMKEAGRDAFSRFLPFAAR